MSSRSLVVMLAAAASLLYLAGCGESSSSVDEDSDTSTYPDVGTDVEDVPEDAPGDVPVDEVEDPPSDGGGDVSEDVPGEDVAEDPPLDAAEDVVEDVPLDTLEDAPTDLPTEEVAPYCGDGTPDTDEECDDGNDVSGDGCENDCTWTCELDTDCLDSEECNGDETCDTTTHTCLEGAGLVDGTLCEADGLATTRDVCVSEVCQFSECGDGFADLGGGEQCDDGNDVTGDGCENDCTYSDVEVTGYRVVTLEVVDPHLYTQVLFCTDITGTANTEFQNGIDAYDLNLVNLFRPLDMALATNPDEFFSSATCTAGTPDSCTRDASTAPVFTTANNEMSGSTTCLAADTSVLNPTYSSPNQPMGPCFYTDAETFNIDLGGILITLQDAQIAATYEAGTPPGTLVTGIIIGFLSTADAQAAVLPADLPLIGGDTLYEHLADARAPGSACETALGTWSVDDSDLDGTEEGFWFHLDFTAELIDWTDP